ncbi:DNA repair exonuclease [Parahaliea maris]|uniref:DNA repair exonuclease n=1 Tax=Parahaliea maris TaxID=2716870 RepID=A0A5C9A6Z8_9GAMM|nr:DNA repair exonuclease [Parahaliea maris]TXS95440.1 DNA repair exonuclease [Parahaliea maris]
MPRFIHTADWQMGRQYSRFESDDAAMLVEARFTAIERIAELANETACDAVLVAGDVFDSQTVADRTLLRVFNAMAGFAGPWVLLPGNHDAALSESVWTRAQRLQAVPDNVILALSPGVYPLPEQGLAILAAPLLQRHTYDDLTAAFDTLASEPGLLRIGLAHGAVQGLLAEDIDSANPIAPDRVQRAQLDYLALGDWHGMKSVNERCWYSGTPEPERFRDNDPGYALVVEVSSPGEVPDITPHAIGRYQWQQRRQEFTVASDLDVFIEALQQVSEYAVLELTLAGQMSLADEERLAQALRQAHARCRSLQWNDSDLRLLPTEDDIANLHADGYLEDVIAELNARQAAGEDETARDALLILASLLRERQPVEGVKA